MRRVAMISDNSPLSELIYFRNDFFSQECPVSLFSVPYNSVLSKVPPYMAIGDIAEFYFHFQKKKDQIATLCRLSLEISQNSFDSPRSL